MAVIEKRYSYAAASSLSGPADHPQLLLACENVADAPTDNNFLRARALFPDVTARSLRAVSEIVGSRFYVPPAMLARILREADPVATVSADTVRFEGFSACCSAYIRLDMGKAALEVAHRQNGTTNVDFGPALRSALATVDKEAVLDLGIGSEAVEIVHDGNALVEKKVPLPPRWIKGFAEVQIIMAGMKPAYSLSRVAAQRFFHALPRSKDDTLHWVSVVGGLARLSARETPGAVPLRGGHRLRVLDSLIAKAAAVDVFVNQDTGATAWVMDLGAQRLTLVLNMDPWRGFSGDGGLLTQLATSDGAATAAVRAQLNWQSQIDVNAMSSATGLSQPDIEAALAELAAIGLVGFDLMTGRYFHRVLPFDLERVRSLNPRLKAADRLVASGAVRMVNENAAEVVSDGVTHRLQRDDGGWLCTCPWYAKNAQLRGPCKHILAVEMYLDQPQ
ncbi:MAG: SWIM zinc finger family protein [Pseudomonadota bacterium]